MIAHYKNEKWILISFFLICSIIFFISNPSSIGYSDNQLHYSNDIIENKEFLNLSYNSSFPIHIIGDSGWIDLKNAGRCTGNGTIYDPYVIEDLIIDGWRREFCILIENSTVYFEIKNCYLHGAQWDWDHNIRFGSDKLRLAQNVWNFSAVVLSYVNNAQLFNNTISSNGRGIFLLHSNKNNITRNNIRYNDDCDIELYNSNNTLISDNLFTKWDYSLILYLHSSNNNIIMRNTFINQYGGCWSEIECEGNIFINNYCSPYHALLGFFNGLTIFLFSITLFISLILLITKKTG